MGSTYRAMNPTERWQYQRRKEEERIERRRRDRIETERLVATVVARDPCIRCQVPAHRHDDLGCRQYLRGRH